VKKHLPGILDGAMNHNILTRIEQMFRHQEDFFSDNRKTDNLRLAQKEDV
jgi:hypothetical protein